MLLRKEGFPEENEIVLCTVTNIYFHSVFVNLDEYDKSGMIHISEISPGRIRNIRDFVKEGKKIICKVLKIKEDKGHIDLSLRRVNEMQRRNKKEEVKKELLAESIVDVVAKKLKKTQQEVYAQITDKVFEEYASLHEPFELVSVDELDLASLGVDKKLAKEFTEAIKQRIKPQVIEIKGDFKLISYEPDAVKDIKEAVAKARKVKGDYRITYNGAGNYGLVVKAADYKAAESVMDEVSDVLVKEFIKRKGEASFARQEA